MNIEQLKQLAATLRELVTPFDLKLSHAQALNVIAALPGLRNWSEVKAFPDRVAPKQFDLASMERLSRRLRATRPEAMTNLPARLFTAEGLMGQLAPWLLDAPPPDPSRRDRLIIVTSDSARGGLRHSGIAAHVEAAWSSLVWGPVPTTAAPPDFVNTRFALWKGDPGTTDQPESWERGRSTTDLLGEWSDHHLNVVSEFERIELWIDPVPNAQLLMLQMLHWFGHRPELVERLFVCHAEWSIGGRSPFELRESQPSAAKVTEDDLEVAINAWKAYGQPTPEAWFGLLAKEKDLRAFPQLYRTVEMMLGELPDSETGLGMSQRRILELIAAGGAVQKGVHAGMALAHDPNSVYGYWEVGRLLDGLAHAEIPAVLGLADGPFDLKLHDDRERFARYRDSALGLTDFGHSLLVGKADLAHHVVIRHWWGGTKLTNDRLWRWEASTKKLRPPKEAANPTIRRSSISAKDRLAAGRTALKDGKFDEALAAFQWFFDHALEESRSLSAVRSSFCLSYWAKLGETHPPAHAALVALRDDKRRVIEEGDLNENVYDDLMSINWALQDRESTYQIFLKIYQMDPALACSHRWSHRAFSSIVAAGNLALARECLGDPAKALHDVVRSISLHRINEPRLLSRKDFEIAIYEERVVSGHVSNLQRVLDVLRHTDGHEASAQLLRTAAVDLLFDELGRQIAAKLQA